MQKWLTVAESAVSRVRTRNFITPPSGGFFLMWNFIVKALKEALKEKVTEMTKEEVKEWLDKIGVKVEEVTDELIAKVEAQKALLDAETRRKTRLFWGPVGLLIGAVVGYVCAAFF